MGVFTVGRQVALEIDMPGWWLANASVDMDFRRGLYYDSSTANPRAATDFLSCVRASVGYAKTAAGTLTSFATNTLRITDLGLLCEDARTNLLLRSQEFDDTAWAKTNAGTVTATANATAAPDGTTTADLLTCDGSDSNRMQGNSASGNIFTATSGVAYALSIYAKANSGSTWCELFLGDFATSNARVWFNLTGSGVVGSNAVVGDGVLDSSSIESLANGWYRLTINTHMSVTHANSTLAFYPCASGDGLTTTTNGHSMYVWGAQAEAGAFASSYVPTTTVTVTRAADNITISSTLQTVINAATGSLVAQTDNGGGAGFAANVVDSNGTNLLGFDASNHALASITATLATGNTANRTTQDKLGLAWTSAARSLVLNGGTVATDASSQTPSATQHVGSSGSANFVNAYVERLSAWTTKLADATLQGFTT